MDFGELDYWLGAVGEYHRAEQQPAGRGDGK